MNVTLQSSSQVFLQSNSISKWIETGNGNASWIAVKVKYLELHHQLENQFWIHQEAEVGVVQMDITEFTNNAPNIV